MEKPNLLIFASGSKDGGGSGAQKLIENARTGILDANIVGLISNHPGGGVFEIANYFNVPFSVFYKPFTAEKYTEFTKRYKADFISLSGWVKFAQGVNPAKTINIHPGPLRALPDEPDFGGKDMYGHYVHEAVIEAFQEGKIKISAVSMHFVTDQYDRGPLFFKFPVYINQNDTPQDLAQRVNRHEHGWQSFITNLVVTGQISWDGNPNHEVIVPVWYKQMEYCPKNLRK